MEEHEITRAMAALAHPVRLSIFRALVVVGQPGLTPGTMAEALGLAAATLSFHLKELVHGGLVTQQRTGRHLVYRADYGCMNNVITYLTANCCQGANCEIPCK